MKVIVFDVEHGACAFMRSPSNHAMLIDCGCTQAFSPSLYIAAHELPTSTPYDGRRLTHLTITHPHDDHICDISALKAKSEPALLKRQRYDWEDVKACEEGYDNLDLYANWQDTYNVSVDPPDYGMKVERFYLTPSEAKTVDKSKYINNSSIVTVATVVGSVYTQKFLFAGDMETAGWDALLKKQNGFKEAVKGITFYIVPHHGHQSGFSESLFAAMGRPILNVVSIHHGDENIDGRYSNEAYASGIQFNGELRRSLTTRKDGSIVVSVGADGKAYVSAVHFDDNKIAKAAVSW